MTRIHSFFHSNLFPLQFCSKILYWLHGKTNLLSLCWILELMRGVTIEAQLAASDRDPVLYKTGFSCSQGA